MFEGSSLQLFGFCDYFSENPGQMKDIYYIQTPGVCLSVAVTSVEASADPTEISVGGITQVVANVLPANATDKKITYSTSNEAVAVVNAETGVVTGVSAGKATITARSANGKTDSVEITVTEAIKVTAITIEPSSPVEVDINGVAELSATVEPATASAKLVKWSSDNDAIATVDDNGKVT